jgi:hypothetical protein
VALTYFAELVAPILAVFGGRRGRWVAFGTWIAFQAGIELTNNFGWLNAASIALGFLLLDDEMVATAALKLKLRPPGWLRAPKAMPLAIASWKLYGLRTALWTHFCLTLYFFGCLFGSPMEGLPSAVSRSLKSLVENFHSANPYTLYGGLLPARYVVEFEGTNDGGKTWRTYDFRYQPQRTDRICPFIAPWYPRFEATLQIEATYSKPSPLYSLVARHLLAGNLGANGLFQRDPFPDRPPTIIRMPVYRLTFTDSATRRQTGDFWRKEYKGQYLPMVVAAASATDAVRLMAEQGNAKAQNHLGNMYAAGRGLTKDSAEAAKWYRKAAEQGLADAQSTLGVMYAEGDGVARDEVEALVWFILAARGGDQDARKNREIAESRIGPAGVLAARQRSDIIAAEIETRKNRK